MASPGFCDAGTEKNHCHQLAFNSPKVFPDGGELDGKTPGFRLSANATGVDMISAIPTITTAMLLRQYFTLTFMTVYLLFLARFLWLSSSNQRWVFNLFSSRDMGSLPFSLTVRAKETMMK